MSVFNFTDYKAFLRSYISKLPKNGRGEINRMATHIEVHPSLISQILTDSKNLSLEQAYLVKEYLALTETESEYFLCMVQLDRAGTTKLKNYFKNKMEVIKKESVEIGTHIWQDRQLTEDEKAIVYSHWLYPSIWLMTGFKGGKTLEEVAQAFQISRERAAEILKFLVQTHLCVLEKSNYVATSQSIHVPRNSIHAHKHHTNWRLKAIESRDKITEEEIMYSAPISISKADFAELRERLFEAIKEVTGKAVHSDADSLACFNVDFFWIKK